MPEDQALQRLTDILSRPEFQVDHSVPWWQQLLQPVFDFVWRLVARLLQVLLASATGEEGLLGWSVIAGCLVLVVAVAIYLVRAVRLSVTRDSRLRTASLAERRQRSEQLWQSAQQLAAAGNLAEAVRLAYLSALYALDERALLHVETNLTNREHARRLEQQHPSLGGGFAELVERYDRVRYGHVSVGRDTFEDFSGRAQRVRSAALQGSAAA